MGYITTLKKEKKLSMFISNFHLWKNRTRKSTIDHPEEPIRVAAVDDDPIQLEILKVYLEPEKEIRLNTFLSPTEALEGIIADKFDCIVTDFRMGDMDGVEFLYIIRNVTSIPVIMYTMVDDEQLSDIARKAGINKLITKGSDFISIKKLTDEIKKQVKAYRGKKESAKSMA